LGHCLIGQLVEPGRVLCFGDTDGDEVCASGISWRDPL